MAEGESGSGENFAGLVMKFVSHEDEVRKRVDEKMKKCLYGAANYTRKYMHDHMKKSSGPSQPGEFPNSHKGTLRELVKFDVEESSQSFRVGPVLFEGSKDRAKRDKTVPQLLNEGGEVTRTVKQRKRTRQVRQRYKPRPFVALTRPIAQEIMMKNIETYEL